MKYKKWWMSPGMLLISTAFFLGSFYFIPMLFSLSSNNNWTSLPFVFIAWGIWFLILLPVFSLVYARKALLSEKNKILFTLYNSVLIILPWLVRIRYAQFNAEVLLVALVPFLWAEIWALVGVFVKRKK